MGYTLEWMQIRVQDSLKTLKSTVVDGAVILTGLLHLWNIDQNYLRIWKKKTISHYASGRTYALYGSKDNHLRPSIRYNAYNSATRSGAQSHFLTGARQSGLLVFWRHGKLGRSLASSSFEYGFWCNVTPAAVRTSLRRKLVPASR